MPLPKGYRFTDNPKNTMLRVRLDDETVEKLNDCAESLNTSKSEVVRIGIDKVYNETKK